MLLADGTSKPIDQVKVGDTVANAAPDSPTVEAHTVTAVHVTDIDHDFVDLTLDTLAGPKTITTTAHHLSWDTTTHTWTDAQDLKTGEELDTPGNGHATIQALRPYTATIRTYNLTIDTLHTYYVLAGTTPVLVHNCGVTYVTYTKTNPLTGEVYSGRTSGIGDPAKIVAARDAGHHMNAEDFPARWTSQQMLLCRGLPVTVTRHIRPFVGGNSNSSTSLVARRVAVGRLGTQFAE